MKTCRALGIRVVPELTAIGDHPSNGGAERAVELIRGHAHILVKDLQTLVAAILSMVGPLCIQRGSTTDFVCLKVRLPIEGVSRT